MESNLPYYKRELHSLYTEIKELAKNHPNLLDSSVDNLAENPHIKLLIESFSLLHANAKLRLEENFVEYISTLFDILYPHYNTPVPSITIVELELNSKQATPVYLAKGNLLEMSYEETKCTFQTCYNTFILPAQIQAAVCRKVSEEELSININNSLGAKSVLSIEIEAINKTVFNKFNLDNLRLHIKSITDIKYLIYKNLLNNVVSVVISEIGNNANSIILDKASIKKVGFEEDENLFSYDKNSFIGYRLISEFFIFGDKFLFFDIDLRQKLANFTNNLKISFYINNEELIDLVSKEYFSLNAVPIINLFPMESDPIEIRQDEIEYPIIIDNKNPGSHEVYAVNKVNIVSNNEDDEIHNLFNCSYQASITESMYMINRKKIIEANIGKKNEVFISLIKKNGFNDKQTNYFYVIADCFNGDLPQKLYLNNFKKFVLVNNTLPIAKVVCINKLSKAYESLIGKDKKWSMVAHLSKNYLNLMNDVHAKSLLRDILSMYEFGESVKNRQLVESIEEVKVLEKIERINVAQYNNFCKGNVIEIYLNELILPKGLPYLFLSILEQFLAMYCSINSFIQLVAKSKNDGKLIYKGSLRNGKKCLS